ncbi:signal peptidase I [Clostridium sartagoforme AAU1]|uniref:Signal peptidase I n=1 Tax=Clostridium sartagoforme AAU1 TaxID=1202534 RepID=R9CFB4_9CLOT|nr:signal peptidase I [Clostridium sartagoforme]EOR25886.1 signal peptidase I [Clostridium sartagoforme AAU1]
MNYKKIINEIKGIALTILGSIIIVAIVNTEVLASAKVQQESMENTLYSDEKLIVDKVSYNFTTPKRGDIIIFFDNEEKGNILEEGYEYLKEIASISYNTDTRTRLVKRVIGIPGDEIDIRDGYVYLNGSILEELYVKGETYSRDKEFPIKVEEDTVFVLGDNREVSKDSRNFGLVNINQIEGKAIFRISPFNRLGFIK